MHEAGWHICMHSCGRINDIIEDLIEIALDIINLIQPRVLGIEEIWRKFRGSVCSETLCDIQHTLPLKGFDDIRKVAKLLLKYLSSPMSGYILLIDEYELDLNVSPEKSKIMLDAIMETDPWAHQH